MDLFSFSVDLGQDAILLYSFCILNLLWFLWISNLCFIRQQSLLFVNMFLLNPQHHINLNLVLLFVYR
jgi:hypothetical protein